MPESLITNQDAHNEEDDATQGNALKILGQKGRFYLALFMLSFSITMMGLALRKSCHYASHIFMAFVIKAGSTVSHLATKPWYFNRPYLPFLMIPIGFLVIYYITDRYFIGADRGGIPQSKYALTTKRHAICVRILSLRTVLGKFLLTTGSFFCGASMGLEGPMIFMSTALTYSLSKLKLPVFKEEAIQRLLIVTGGAIGISVAFNTPLSGIAFVIEEHHRPFNTRLARILIPPIIMSMIICDFFIKRTQYFAASTSAFQASDWVVVPFIGIIAGLLGGLFCKILFRCMQFCSNFKKRGKRVLLAAACGLCIAVLGYFSNGNTYGAGFFETDHLIMGQGYLSVSFCFLKTLATLFSYISGIPGGLLSPSLSIGAGLGNQMSLLFLHTDHNIVIILTMLAYFTGVLQHPITCLLIVLEMTGRSDLVVPMMTVAWLAKFASSIIFREPLYHALSKLCQHRYRDSIPYSRKKSPEPL